MTWDVRPRWFATAACALALAACGRRATPLSDLNLTEVTFPNGRKILCETMIRDIDVTRGLMFRDSLPPDRGMILVQTGEAKRPAFTYNVRIPLDIVWMDRNQRIVEIASNAAPCREKSARDCPLYGGKEKSRYVLELNSGVAAANGLKTGDRLSF
jgi:hypothetical protein